MPATTIPSEAPKELTLREVKVGDPPVSILARVVRHERREVVRRSDGGRRPVLAGLLSDGTATIRFTWWDPPKEGVEDGTVLRAVRAEVREFRGRPELTFSFRTQVEPASDAELPKVKPEDVPLSRLTELKANDEGRRVEVRIASVGSKSVTVGHERRVLFEGRIADPSGSVSFTAWVDFGLKPGEAVRIVGGYVSTFRGRPQLVLDERSRVERIAGDGLPTLESLTHAPPSTVEELERKGGAEVARVAGTVVGVVPPSGLVHRCPQCRRSLAMGECRVHGRVAGEPDLRARAVLDDGTGALTLNLGRDDTERLWGTTLRQCVERLTREGDLTAIEHELGKALVGRRITATGRASVDEFGVTFYPEAVAIVASDPASEARELRRLLQGGAR